MTDQVIQSPLMGSFAGSHKGEPILVLGTGPSAWDVTMGQSQRFLDVIKGSELTVIGLNRAFAVPNIPLSYQISIDRIWRVFLLPNRGHGKQAVNYHMWKSLFAKWRADHRKCEGINDWSLEDFVSANRDKYEVHPEIWNYFRLCSPWAPFTRFTWAQYSRCPYHSIRFNMATDARKVKYGAIEDAALYFSANVAHAGIHLAAVMSAQPIFLLGVDLADPDIVSRPWEAGANYGHLAAAANVPEPIRTGFKRLANALCQKVHIINLNPKTRLDVFETRKTFDEGVDCLEKEINRERDERHNRRSSTNPEAIVQRSIPQAHKDPQERRPTDQPGGLGNSTEEASGN